MDKPRGRRKAIEAKISHMRQGWQPEMGKEVIVGHGNCPEDAELLRQAVAENFPDAQIHVGDIGPIIGAHTGPGILALVYWGSNR